MIFFNIQYKQYCSSVLVLCKDMSHNPGWVSGLTLGGILQIYSSFVTMTLMIYFQKDIYCWNTYACENASEGCGINTYYT